MIGQQFGRSVVIARAADRFHKRKERPNGKGKLARYWLLRCDCGREYECSEKQLKYPARKQTHNSCKGCANSGTRNSLFSHGEAKKTPEYRCWCSIKTRCYNKNFKQYKDYGGRGIRVCDQWLSSFDQFLADMGRRPPGHSIQRRDNDGDYCPENCYWATDEEQRRVKRNAKLITIGEVTQNLVDWLVETGTSRATFYWRIRNGWPEEEALFGRQ